MKLVALLLAIFAVHVGAKDVLPIRGHVIFPASGVYTDLPTGSCLHVAVKSSGCMDDCPVNTVAEDYISNFNVTDYKVGFEFLVKKKKIPAGQYAISATLNVGWCSNTGDEDEWIRKGDYLSDTVHEFRVQEKEETLITTNVEIVPYGPVLCGAHRCKRNEVCNPKNVTCDPKKSACPVDDDTDYYGNDMKAIYNVASAEDCRAKCKATPKCRFFTWVKPDADGEMEAGYNLKDIRNKCHLKQSKSKPAEVVGLVSGAVECRGEEMDLHRHKTDGHKPHAWHRHGDRDHHRDHHHEDHEEEHHPHHHPPYMHKDHDYPHHLHKKFQNFHGREHHPGYHYHESFDDMIKHRREHHQHYLHHHDKHEGGKHHHHPHTTSWMKMNRVNIAVLAVGAVMLIIMIIVFVAVKKCKTGKDKVVDKQPVLGKYFQFEKTMPTTTKA